MKHVIRVLSALTLALTATVTGVQAQENTFSSDNDRFSYGLGMLIGERILKQYGEVNYEVMLEGMKHQHQGQATRLTVEEAGAAINAQQASLAAAKGAEARQRGEEYLAGNKAKQGVKVTPSGLQYEIITDAEGPRPKTTDTVTVHYAGKLLDGTEFDSSYKRGEPSSFQLNQVIPGWTEGLQLMSVGARYRFVIPHDLAYGERGAGDRIGPFETLIFEVELIEIGS